MKKFEGSIKHYADLLDAIIDSSYDGLWICDGKGTVLMINKASERINEIEAKEVIGRNVKDLVQEGMFDESVTLRVIKEKKPVTIMQHLKSGKKLLVTGNPIFIEGELRYIVTNDRDITELTRLKAELEESRKITKKYFEKLQEVFNESKKGQLVFCSKEMKRVFDIIKRVSEVDVTVFLQGESGVGKSHIARMIHNFSERARYPFVQVNCGSIPETLLESELFGYVGGAFTGAKKEGKAGMVETAHHGTLFLDEITEMPLNLQVKLLHFLDSGKMKRVGDTLAKEIDVRIIAASNRKVENYVKEKRFREDLYFRLNIVPVNIPPLRERKDDIPLLIAYFLERFDEKYGKDVTISPEAVDLLCRYSFPGNIRELSNILERLVVMSRNTQIKVGDLPDYVKEDMLVPIEGNSAVGPLKTTLKNVLAEYEKNILKQAMTVCRTQLELAAFLGVSQPTVARKLRQYRLESPWKTREPR